MVCVLYLNKAVKNKTKLKNKRNCHYSSAFLEVRGERESSQLTVHSREVVIVQE